MKDKDLMQDILLLEKGACDLYLHGTIESSNEQINHAFKTALNNSLTMQDDIYKQMEHKGWYKTEQVEQNQINTVKQKFSASM